MSRRIHTLQVGEVRKRPSDVFQSIRTKILVRRLRLHVAHVRPYIRAFQAGPEVRLFGKTQKPIDDFGVDGLATLCTRQLYRRLAAAKLVEHVKEDRGV